MNTVIATKPINVLKARRMKITNTQIQSSGIREGEITLMRSGVREDGLIRGRSNPVSS